jgi:acetyl-CoA C-acetyltransferase
MPPLAPDRQPVVVGVGQLRSNTERRVELAREPLDLIVDALDRAGADSGTGDRLLRAAEAIAIPSVSTWTYEDLPGLVARRVGATPRHLQHTDVGGNRPAELLDVTAARIAAGELAVALLAGGESRASLAVLQRAGVEPDWTRQPGGPRRYDESVRGSERMWVHGLMAPVRVYPLYENAVRDALGQSFEDAQHWTGEILSDFTVVASTHPAAWNQQIRSPEEMVTVTAANRYICFPYTLLMNSFPNVDQAAALIVTSLQAARDAGVAEDRIVHVWGGSGAADSKDVLDRAAFDRSPGLEHVLRDAVERGGLGADQLDAIDLYACFPVVPKLGALALGLPRGRRLTATGGNTAFGGPGNNFSMHALASVVDELRRGGRYGLVYANGEYFTKHHAIVLATEPHPAGYVGGAGEVTSTGGPGPRVVDVAEGPATIETSTVEFDREGKPASAYLVGRLPDGSRFAANGAPDDVAFLEWLVDPSTPTVGRPLVVRHEGDRNLASRP